MKMIKNVKQKFPHPEKEATEEQKNQMPTFRGLVYPYLCNYVPRTLEESESMNQIRLKFMVEGDDVTLEDGEFKKLFDNLKTNPTSLPNHLFVGVIGIMKDAEALKLEVEIKEAK